jgi:transcriptional regulator with XRE-family HTH domain
MQRYPSFELALGDQIAKAREKLSLSQRALSARLGRRINYIQLIECGRQPVTASGLSEIAIALKTTGSDLLAGAERAAPIRLRKG